MNTEYPAHYTDQHGEEETIIRHDGKTLRMEVRGVAFSGTRFEDFTPDEGTDPSALASLDRDFRKRSPRSGNPKPMLSPLRKEQ